MFSINEALKYEYILTLCRPNKEPICELANDLTFFNLVYTGRFPTTDEITFKIPYYVMNNGEQIKNKVWDLIKGDYLIHCRRIYHESYIDEKYFVIRKVQLDNNQTDIKGVQAYSLEYELNRKIVRGYSLPSRKLYSLTNEIDEDGYQVGILNYITTLTSWSIGDIDADLLTKFRTIDVSESTILDMLTSQVQPSFGCVFIFDTVNQKINAKKIEGIGQDKGFYISEANYIKSIDIEVDHSEVVTRLYVYGKDGISINELNPSGAGFVEDYSYYKNLEYMSQELINALDSYGELLEDKNGVFIGYLDQLEMLNSQLDLKHNELNTLENELAAIRDNMNTAIQAGDNIALATWKAQETSKLNLINAKNIEISTINNSINFVYSQINILRNEIKKENNFSSGQLVELDRLTHEIVWSDSNYESAQDLWDNIPNILNKVNQPPLIFNIDSVDFLQVLECQRDWKKFVLGDIANIDYPKFNFDVQVRMVGYTHDFDGRNLSLNFSNQNSLDDPALYLAELQKQVITSATTLNMSKFNWDKSEENANEISQIINNAWDSAKNAVLAGKNQNIIMNERGIALTDTTSPNEQLKIVNNTIAMTNDNWNTVKLAIVPGKIYAEYLFGQIIAGNNLTIQNSSGTFNVNANGITVTNMNLSMTGNSGNSRILINPSDGIRIQQKSGSNWVNKFYTDSNGNAVFSGNITGSSFSGGTITIGSGNNVFKADNNGIYLGHASFGSAPFRVNMTGQLTASGVSISNGTFSASSIVGGTITIGSGNNMFKVDSNGIYLGSSSYSSAPFRASMSGQLRATNANISGIINATSGSFTGTIYATSGTLGNLNITGTLTGGEIYGSRFTGSEFIGGTIDVSTDINVGNNIYLRPSNYYVPKGVYFTPYDCVEYSGSGGLSIDASDIIRLSSDELSISISGDIYMTAYSNDITINAGRLRLPYNTTVGGSSIATTNDLSSFITYSEARADYCRNASSQRMSFQVYSGNLEVFVNGTQIGSIPID